jgi:nucleoside-diphosphate-sugar epimerase
MRVAVTGGAGKLGQWVVRELRDASEGREPHEVIVLDRVKGPEQDGVRYLVGDVTELGQVVGTVAGTDAIIHLAAVRRWGEAPNDVTFRTNVMGSFNVHEAAWRLGIRRVVSVSSEAALGWDYREREFAPEYLPIDESHPIRPQDCYGLSKEVGEAIARSYTAKCGMETVVLRPPWIAAPEELDEVRRAGGREPTRFSPYNYIDVRDLAEAFRLAIERPIEGHVVLFVTADDSAVGEPLSEVLPRFLPETAEMARPFTGTRPAVSNARAKEVLGWRPRRSWRRETPSP